MAGQFSAEVLLKMILDKLNGTINTSGGGGGGAVTIADGADVVEGSTADAAVTTNANGTISAKLRGIITLLAAKIGVTIADGDNVVEGAVADAVVAAGATGSISAKLRAISRDLVANIVLAAGRNIIGVVKTRYFAAAAGNYTRPANTTPYSIGDIVANDGTAANVTAISFSVSDTNDDPITLERVRINTNDTGPATASATFEVWFYNVSPLPPVNGDNGAFSVIRTGFLGRMSGTFMAMSDGSVATCIPVTGNRIITTPVSGAKTVLALLKTLTAFTPSTNSTVYTLTVEGFQGVA